MRLSSSAAARKLRKLCRILKRMDSLLVAYSGGADSTLLLKAAADTLGRRVVAVTAASATYPAEELTRARRFARALRVRHQVIRTTELGQEEFRANPPERCFYCKYELFSRLERLRRKHGLNFIADASNASDLRDFRPGSKAKKIFHVRSPLQEAGIAKDGVRKISRSLGLATWDKPSQACLASRIPYGRRISVSALKRIERAEHALKRMGFLQVRARHYDTLCSIEVPAKDLPALIGARIKVYRALQKLGYSHVTLDLLGYRSGSLNEALALPKKNAGFTK
ncbi:MAG: ATP-dependent sacrificial sulfur transferase LarE [Candidatus Omnitrophica bacterium]|nr:ATP-dependent sacrificial sulfur transferase LarE [Candidatus Omnitrophota bacterium]